MHALPGCSSPRQSYAGQHCAGAAPNTWNGRAADGVAGVGGNTRAHDGKTSWLQVAQRIAVSRVVPWLKFIDALAPGTLIGFETVNEPDIGSADASAAQVRRRL